MEYYIDERIEFCYPYEPSQYTNISGELQKHIRKMYSRDEMDEIICELIRRHPFIENSMHIKIYVRHNNNFYHILTFKNDNYEEQQRGSLEVKYEN